MDACDRCSRSDWERARRTAKIGAVKRSPTQSISRRSAVHRRFILFAIGASKGPLCLPACLFACLFSSPAFCPTWSTTMMARAVLEARGSFLFSLPLLSQCPLLLLPDILPNSIQFARHKIDATTNSNRASLRPDNQNSDSLTLLLLLLLLLFRLVCEPCLKALSLGTELFLRTNRDTFRLFDWILQP